MKWISVFGTLFILLTSCSVPPAQLTVTPIPTESPQANMPNPASTYCEEQGNRLEIRTAADGSQSGVCIFPDGSECDEWAYFRKECGPIAESKTNSAPTSISTAMPIDPADYDQTWWTYTHPIYSFSIMLPQDWTVEEITTSDPLMAGHSLYLRPNYDDKQNIHMAFRRIGEDVGLWPTGVGQGEFIQQGTLDIGGQPARRFLLVCPNGDVTSIWYHDGGGQPNIARGDMEISFIYSAGDHCEPGLSLGGKIQRSGEMIIASLKMP